eukprot:3678813-Rhodomonas_salina.3
MLAHFGGDFKSILLEFAGITASRQDSPHKFLPNCTPSLRLFAQSHSAAGRPVEQVLPVVDLALAGRLSACYG